MKTRNSALFALGLAAALTLGGAMTASAQDTTRARSQRRIPVRKEQPAPQPVRVDTVTITRTDTVVRTRTDTVTVTRVDTVTRIEELPLQRLPGWQFGLATGLDIPTGAWLQSNRLGWTGHAHLGWFPGTSPVGIRVDGDYSNFGAQDWCPNCSSTSLWQLSGELVWRIPLDRKSKVNPQIYFLGGGGFDWFNDFIPFIQSDRTIVNAGSKTVTVGTLPSGLPVAVVSTDEGGTFGHWSLGGGVQLGGFFLESQYKSIGTNNGNSNHVPVLVGWNWNF
jgi:hypothetical protein